MALLRPPISPMEALSVSEIPHGPEWVYEPKWDGFRCVVFRDGSSVALQSKSDRGLDRYFPEIVAAVKRLPAEQFVLDGELAVPIKGAFSFDDLLQRIHPAQSRVRMLATQTPAIMIVFDLLSVDGRQSSRAFAGQTPRRPRKVRRARLSQGENVPAFP